MPWELLASKFAPPYGAPLPRLTFSVLRDIIEKILFFEKKVLTL